MRIAREQQVLARPVRALDPPLDRAHLERVGARVALTRGAGRVAVVPLSDRAAVGSVLARQAKQSAKSSERLHRDPLARSSRHERVIELKHDFR